MAMRIFGSPLRLFQTSRELFNNNYWDEQVKEWVSVLLQENERLKKDAHPEADLVMAEAASLAFIVSKKLKLPTNVKYIALDIYHRFCIQHIQSLTKIVRNEVVKGDKEISLTSVQEKVGMQAPLRVLTCLRIASKLTRHNKIISSECVRKVLKDLGNEFSLNSVNKSEMRVLNEISFECRYASSPPEYIGVLVALVSTTKGSLRESTGSEIIASVADDLYKSALQLLDAMYLQYNQIYDELYYRVTGSKIKDPTCRLAFVKILSDRMLLASSLIAAAGWVLGGDRLSRLVTGKIIRGTNIPEEDINIMASCIVKTIIGKD